MKTTKKTETEKLSESLMNVCLIYSDFKNNKRRMSFGNSMYERLKRTVNLNALYENEIIYKGAQWGGKWGNFYKAIFYRDGEFYLGSGFSNKQILGL